MFNMKIIFDITDWESYIFNINIVCEYRPTSFAVEAQSREMEDAREKNDVIIVLASSKASRENDPRGQRCWRKMMNAPGMRGTNRIWRPR